MLKYTESDIFAKMNTGNSIYNDLVNAIKSIDAQTILNPKITESLEQMHKAYRETMTLRVIEAVKSYEIVIIAMPINKRFPANIPFVKTKRQGRDCAVVDLSKYATVVRDNAGNIVDVKCDIPKLYNILIPAYISLHVLNDQTVISSETTKWMAYLWARLFNRVLMSQRIFVGNQERYEAFMYFAMRFFMIYYLQTPEAIVNKISDEFIKGAKSNYIMMIENNLKQRDINLYKDWSTFAFMMFSNEITNIRAITSVEMNVEQYLRTYSNYMGKDGAYLALWSADYFFFCIFATYNHAYILNDRAWDDIVNDNPKIVPRILSGLYKEV